MADLARIYARQWLLSPRRLIGTPAAAAATSSCLGFKHSLGQKRDGISTTAACGAAKRDKFTRPRKPSKSAAMQKGKLASSEAMPSLLLPLTIVPPPIWRFPRSPVKFGQLVWLILKNRVKNLGALLGVYFISMRTKGLSRPLFRAHKRAAIPAAKALHAQMSEAVAAGDKDALRRICTPELFETFAGAIDARPAGIRSEWELVRYDNKLRYPRLADFRVTYQPKHQGASAGGGASNKGLRLVKQAVVSISSVQRLARYDDTRGGELVPGSERERHLTEHVVLQANVKDGTFEAEPWKVWGTLPEMTYETMRDDDATYNEFASTAR
ncbi:hypothetical protein F5B17DRAFT_419808 [Nemania serpens]|nr:hypothetical protein F5B17DRAFT_419808 [Nemania serpens]